MSLCNLLRSRITSEEFLLVPLWLLQLCELWMDYSALRVAGDGKGHASRESESGLFPIGFPIESRQAGQSSFLVLKSQTAKVWKGSWILTEPSTVCCSFLLISVTFLTPLMELSSLTTRFFSAYHLCHRYLVFCSKNAFHMIIFFPCVLCWGPLKFLRITCSVKSLLINKLVYLLLHLFRVNVNY